MVGRRAGAAERQGAVRSALRRGADTGFDRLLARCGLLALDGLLGRLGDGLFLADRLGDGLFLADRLGDGLFLADRLGDGLFLTDRLGNGLFLADRLGNGLFDRLTGEVAAGPRREPGQSASQFRLE